MVTRIVRAVPNAITLARLVLGVGFPWIPPDWRVTAIAVAALSDLVDGMVSRHFHATGTTGRILDPIADKVFILSVAATLLVEERLRLSQLALIGLRDWAVLLGGGWLAVRHGCRVFREMPPTLLGKATTALQFVFALTLLTAESAARIVFIPTAVVSGVAALNYLWLGLREAKPPPSRTPQGSKT